jgi:hypothetical protein
MCSVITGNGQLASVEMGLCSGATVKMLHNDDDSQLLVVQVGDTRLTVPRSWADAIYVQPLDASQSAGNTGSRKLLAEIRSYLRAHERVGNRSLAIRFEMQPEAMEGMMTQLEKRGMVQRHSQVCSSGCAGCKGCGVVVPSVDLLSWSLAEGAGDDRKA